MRPGTRRRRDGTFRRVRGGSAANVAALTAELGGSARFVGQVGDDHVGQTLVDDLGRRGVDIRVTRAGDTGLIVTWSARAAVVD